MTDTPPGSPVYCAPLTAALSVLHMAEPGVDLAAEPEPGRDRLTRCGMIMAAEDGWLEVKPRTGDRLCMACVASRLGGNGASHA